MSFEALSFSSVRLSILSGAHTPDDHQQLKIELHPKNLIDSFDINSFCFYVNKSFGILKNDYYKIVKILKKKNLKFDIKDDHLKILDDFYIIKFQSGNDIINYFQNINMNGNEERPRISNNQLLRENSITSFKAIKSFIENKNPTILSLDIEIQKNKEKIFEPSECGFVFFENGKYEHKHYLIKEYYEQKTGNGAKLQKKFSFGKTEIVTLDEFVNIIKEYLFKTDLFLAHSVNSENHYLSKMGIELPYFVDKIVDTQLIYKDINNNSVRPISLFNMLKSLNIKNKDLHNSGNDAAYTLIAFNEMLKIK